MDLLNEASEIPKEAHQGAPIQKSKARSTSGHVVSLANFQSTHFIDSKPYLNSPRSIEVCKLNGVSVDDLVSDFFWLSLEA